MFAPYQLPGKGRAEMRPAFVLGYGGPGDEDARQQLWFGSGLLCLHRFGSSVAKAFLTSDWEIPNSRAILAGVMPALNAERTAFT
jgi:hypothetical protein